MGKYMREAKIAGDVAVMELSQSTVGVLTRARTLALERRQSSPPPPNPDSSYLQLRSRRLEKPPSLLPNSKKPPRRNQKSRSKQSFLQDPGSWTSQKSDAISSSGFRACSVNSGSVGSISVSCSMTKESCFFAHSRGHEAKDGHDLGIEASYVEDILQSEPRDRETTPCSLVREAGGVTTTRQTNIHSTTTRNSPINLPLIGEMDEFFIHTEQQQQGLFIEKYNFDIVNDSPLPGRYEWVRVSQ